MASKRIKYIRINFIKKVKMFYARKYATLIGKIEDIYIHLL
jgi:hypothetical protein